eukprot:15282538-Alexandrium_andersonii.AAC.1
MGRTRRRRAGRHSTRLPWRGVALCAATPMPAASIMRKETYGALRAGIILRLPDMTRIWTGCRPRWRSTSC